MQLVALASAYDPVKYIRHFRKLKGLIDIWSEDGYFPASHLTALQETFANASSRSDVSLQNVAHTEGSWSGECAVTSESRRDAPYIMPSSHGDISTPFYDLPAGNLIPCIVPNSLSPINPQSVKPVALRAGPADEKLVHAVKSFLHDVDTIYGANRPGNEIETWDIDELGQPILPNDLSGGHTSGEGYYGWSEAFCEEMKLRDNEKPIAASEDGRATTSPTPAFLHQGLFGPGQILVPPPPPPNYHGPWPPPPPVPPPGYSLSPAPATALHGQQSGQYMSQGYQGRIGNPTSLASQPWNQQNEAAASQGRRSRGHR
ncbi:MAG: hypothetical protein Q9211_000224 [Gyalolechia sp. 1 TL-2023]